MKNALPSTNLTEPIDVTPNPEFLIKSIAEQGYSFESALADLIDNSIAADASHIDVLINPDVDPFKLFIADNGKGMTREKLMENMRFPSSSIDKDRVNTDLGRFGLGLKTASFSQTRKFTVLSREKGTNQFYGFTWDVKHLKKGNWEIVPNSNEDISEMLIEYDHLKDSFNGASDDFLPNTIIVWSGLYKFEEFLENRSLKSATLKTAISETTIDHLAIVFHRFLERKADPLSIRVNNRNIIPFNPFPTEQSDFRSIDNRQTSLKDDVIKLEGFVLPSRSIDESKQAVSVWATPSKGLMDLEGIYVYRANRIIVFGGWNDITRKTPTLRLARLRVEVGNKVDNLFHLNVAKSKIIIPHDIRTAFIRYVVELKTEAEKEFYNRGIRHFSKKGPKVNFSLFEKQATDKGMMIEVNDKFPVLDSLRQELSKQQNAKLNFILKIVTTTINKIRHVYEPKSLLSIQETDGFIYDITTCIRELQQAGVPNAYIKNTLLAELGFTTIGLGEEIEKLLNNNIN